MPVSDKDYVAIGFNVADFSHLPLVGKDFPVFLLPDGNELALARVERKISAGYNGFAVEVQNVSLKDDLKRRDITINSIAYDEETNTFIDPFNGMDDLKNKLLRHTSKAFVEDPLRVLRIARFRAKYGYQWQIHPTTKKLISTMKKEMQSLQKERVYKELEKVMELENSYIFFNTLLDLGMLEIIFPNIYNLSTCHKDNKNIFEHAMNLLQAFSNDSIVIKFTALYYYIPNHDEPNIYLPNKIKKRILFIINSDKKLLVLESLSILEIVEFFVSFRKDKTLLDDLIYFYTTCHKQEKLKEKNIIDTFDAISSYSPKKWIDLQKTKPTPQEIHNHLDFIYSDYVKKYLII